MRTVTLLLLLIVLLPSCSSTRYVASWKSEEFAIFQPQQLMVLGITDNLTARKIFEQELRQALEQRNIPTVESTAVLGADFTESRKSEEEIDEMILSIKDKGVDAIMITAVKGVDESSVYTRGHYFYTTRWVRFGRYYYRFQDIYYEPGYYSDYQVFHIETALYDIAQDSDKSLLWVGSFDIVNPAIISETVNDYVKRIVRQLEREEVIQKL